MRTWHTDTNEEPTDAEMHRSMIRYFWEEKGDIERWVGYDPVWMEKHMPHILYLWNEYKDAKQRLDAVIKSL